MAASSASMKPTKALGVSTARSYRNAAAMPAMPPMYIMPGTPRFRLPDFSVRISPFAPNSMQMPWPMAFWMNMMIAPMAQSSLRRWRNSTL